MKRYTINTKLEYIDNASGEWVKAREADKLISDLHTQIERLRGIESAVLRGVRSELHCEPGDDVICTARAVYEKSKKRSSPTSDDLIAEFRKMLDLKPGASLTEAIKNLVNERELLRLDRDNHAKLAASRLTEISEQAKIIADLRRELSAKPNEPGEPTAPASVVVSGILPELPDCDCVLGMKDGCWVWIPTDSL